MIRKNTSKNAPLAQAGATEAQREDYEERAAILEFDAHLSREDAERLAAHWCLGAPLTQGKLGV